MVSLQLEQERNLHFSAPDVFSSLTLNDLPSMLARLMLPKTSPMIHANCRMRLTAEDFSYIVGVLSKARRITSRW